jgi:hypothetical protein
MTLKNTYSCDSTTGINKHLADAYTAGKTFVTDNYADLEEGLEDAASEGKRVFYVRIDTLYKESALRLKGDLMVAYFAGIYSALGDNFIFYPKEVKLTLYTPSTTQTQVQFDFTF